MHSILEYCKIRNVYRNLLKHTVIIVGLCTIVIAAVALFASLGTVLSISNKELVCNANPVNAVDAIFALFCTSTSLYQAAISTMLLYIGRRKNGAPFVLTMWYISHLSIMVLYSFLFLTRTIIGFSFGYPMQSFCSLIAGCLYDGVFIYFCVIINRYAATLEPELTYY